MACMPTNGTKIGSPGVTMSKQVENSHGSALLLTLFGALIGIMACSFLLFIGLGYWLESVPSLQPISRARAAFYFEPMVLTLSVLTLAIITRRLFVSAFIVSGLYVVFMLINAEMMRMFGLVFSWVIMSGVVHKYFGHLNSKKSNITHEHDIDNYDTYR